MDRILDAHGRTLLLEATLFLVIGLASLAWLLLEVSPW